MVVLSIVEGAYRGASTVLIIFYFFKKCGTSKNVRI